MDFTHVNKLSYNIIGYLIPVWVVLMIFNNEKGSGNLPLPGLRDYSQRD